METREANKAAKPRLTRSEPTLVITANLPWSSASSPICISCPTKICRPALKEACCLPAVSVPQIRKGAAANRTVAKAGVANLPISPVNCSPESRPLRFASREFGEKLRALDNSKRTCSLSRNVVELVNRALLLRYRPLGGDTLIPFARACALLTPRPDSCETICYWRGSRTRAPNQCCTFRGRPRRPWCNRPNDGALL